MLPPALQKNLGLYLLSAALSCPLGKLWGRGSALSQAQRQPGPGKVIRGDKALCTHSLFGIQADPRVSSWAAFTAGWAWAHEPGLVSAHPAMCLCSPVLLPGPQPRAGTLHSPAWTTPEPQTDCTQQGIAAFLPWTPCCKQLTTSSLPAEITFALNDSL